MGFDHNINTPVTLIIVDGCVKCVYDTKIVLLNNGLRAFLSEELYQYDGKWLRDNWFIEGMEPFGVRRFSGFVSVYDGVAKGVITVLDGSSCTRIGYMLDDNGIWKEEIRF